MKRPPERIASGELTIRRWRWEDAPALAAAIAASIEHLRPWMSWAAAEPLTDKERVALLAGWDRDWDEGRDRVFGMFLGDEVVGACGLHPGIGPGGLEIGYWVHAAHLRRGYATRAAAALTQAAFDMSASNGGRCATATTGAGENTPALPARAIHESGITHVEIHHDRANAASGGVPRKLGFEFVGEERDGIQAPGEEGVSRIWRLQRAQWLRRQRAAER